MKKINWVLLLTLPFIMTAACRTPVSIEKDPFYESFYEKTRLIMTKEEIEIYKRLPDNASREEFIEEFWRIRDPDTSTEENENKTEFERRIEYANRWFGWRNPDKGRMRPEEQEKYRGWDTERGRIYIVLGPPDSLIYDRSALMNDGRRISSPEGRSEETWGYWRYRLYVTFSRGGMGRWHILDPEPDLFYFLEAAKLNLLASGSREEAKRRLIFEADHEEGNVILSIPVTRMNFVERDGKCEDARIVLGAVAPAPVRAVQAEQAIKGQPLDPSHAEAAAQAAVADALPLGENPYEVGPSPGPWLEGLLSPGVQGVLCRPRDSKAPSASPTRTTCLSASNAPSPSGCHGEAGLGCPRAMQGECYAKSCATTRTSHSAARMPCLMHSMSDSSLGANASCTILFRRLLSSMQRSLIIWAIESKPRGKSLARGLKWESSRLSQV